MSKAKRGRPPKNKTMSDLEPAVLADVDEALRSKANEPASSIFRRYGLAQRGIQLGTFIKYARMMRQSEWTSDLEIIRPPSMQELMDRLLIVAMESAKAGDMKPSDAAALIARVQQHDRLQIERDAEKRAAELHETKLRKLEPAVKDAIAEPTTQGAKDLRAILEAVSNGQTSIDAATRAIGDVIWIEIDRHMRGAA